MVDRTIIEDTSSFVGEIGSIVLEDGKLSEATLNMLVNAIQAVIRKINGKISLGSADTGYRAGNIDGQFIDLVTPSVADTEFIVPHGLKRLPVGWVVVRKSLSAYGLYDSSPGSWTEEIIYLKSNQASASFRILVF